MKVHQLPPITFFGANKTACGIFQQLSSEYQGTSTISSAITGGQQGFQGFPVLAENFYPTNLSASMGNKLLRICISTAVLPVLWRMVGSWQDFDAPGWNCVSLISETSQHSQPNSTPRHVLLTPSHPCLTNFRTSLPLAVLGVRVSEQQDLSGNEA